MSISRRGFLGAALGLLGGAGAARSAPASGGVVRGVDGGAVLGEAGAELVMPLPGHPAGGFPVPDHIADALRGWLTRDEILKAERAIYSVYGGCTRDMPEELEASGSFAGWSNGSSFGS
ncbi:hypothetical protein [Bradyrhizobium cenepequi]